MLTTLLMNCKTRRIVFYKNLDNDDLILQNETTIIIFLGDENR